MNAAGSALLRSQGAEEQTSGEQTSPAKRVSARLRTVSRMKHALRDHLEFFRQFREQFETTGAIAPSGKQLANTLCKPLRSRDGRRRVLEIGPGTGAVTDCIVSHLRGDDSFDLIEINGDFADGLRSRFQSRPHWQRVADQSTVHHCDLDSFDGGPFDVIVSGLPFNNFPTDLVHRLIDRSLDLLAPGGSLSYFEYLYVRPLRRRVGRRSDRLRLTRIDRRLQRRFEDHDGSFDRVFVNLPPACVRHLSKQAK